MEQLNYDANDGSTHDYSTLSAHLWGDSVLFRNSKFEIHLTQKIKVHVKYIILEQIFTCKNIVKTFVKNDILLDIERTDQFQLSRDKM